MHGTHLPNCPQSAARPPQSYTENRNLVIIMDYADGARELQRHASLAILDLRALHRDPSPTLDQSRMTRAHALNVANTLQTLVKSFANKLNGTFVTVQQLDHYSNMPFYCL